MSNKKTTKEVKWPSEVMGLISEDEKKLLAKEKDEGRLPLPYLRCDYVRGNFFGIIAAERGEMDRSGEKVHTAKTKTKTTTTATVFVPLTKKKKKKTKKTKKQKIDDQS
jgi:hypothetical protein